ncbi:MAG TPA: nucleotidyltransferase family protein [Nitrososphaerales archaeon]|nr:nucleotidyltransferase family protein [Nitrososphaerales archaeon]
MISGVILAAGSSTRMGRQKLLAKLGETTVLGRTMASFSSSRLEEVVVVASLSVADALRGSAEPRLRVVVNESPEEGISSSVKLGLSAAKGRAAVIGLGDQPLVQPSTIDALVDAYERSGASIVVPVCRGRRGNPVLFDRSLFPQIMELEGDAGAKSVIARNAGLLNEVAVEDDGILTDVDTEEDLKEARKKLEDGLRRRSTREAGRRPRVPPARATSSTRARR